MHVTMAEPPAAQFVRIARGMMLKRGERGSVAGVARVLELPRQQLSDYVGGRYDLTVQRLIEWCQAWKKAGYPAIEFKYAGGELEVAPAASEG